MTKTLRYYPALLCFFFTLSTGFAQRARDFNCGFDDLRNAAQERNIQTFEEQLQQHFDQKKTSDALKGSGSGLPYIIPIVVHIIHNGGPENIPDAQVLAAVEHMNEAFAAQGYYAQQGATVNTQIQFCLAKRDPDGNATTGITRTQSPLTNMVMETEDIATKNLSRWNPKDYVNIWVVKEITSQAQGPGVAGYAFFPSAHGNPEDGMICEAKFFGTSPLEDAVLTHEMGHYFGLYHTFEGGCKNDDCTKDGDRICDTPPDKATHTTCPFNSCDTDVAPGSPFVTDVDDFTGDFMDYSPFSCYYFFTADQTTRMQAVVETSRKSLLDSKGCADPCTIPVTASFSAVPNPVAAGQTVVFTNNSTGASNYSWTENGTVFSQNQTPTQVFNIPGNYLIALEAGNADPNCKDFAQIIVQVTCPIVAGFSVATLEIDPGETLVFTNTSSGGATDFEWFINGASLATTADFSYLFSNPGYYSVTLQASSVYCSKDKTVQVHVKSPCGDPFFAETTYSINQTLTLAYDMATLPDGSLILCGKSAQQPLISRLDAVGAVIWNKLLNINGSFDDIEALPGGDFVLRGETNGKLLLAKIDADGNILWFQTLQVPGGLFNVEYGVNTLAANPDGSFAFCFQGTTTSRSVGKILADGTLDWIRSFQVLQTTGGLRRATDGSGDFLISTISADPSGLAHLVLRIDQSGNLVTIYNYTLPQESLQFSSAGFLNTHPDGDFSLFLEGGESTSAILGDKFLIRCRPDGQVRVAKKLETNGLNSVDLKARYFPNDGWLLYDYKTNGDNYLFRVSEQNELLWSRKAGDGGVFGDAVLASVKQNGLLRALKWESTTQRLQLLQLPDVYTPIPCLPDTPNDEIVTDVVVQKKEETSPVSVLNLSFSPEPFTLLNAQMSRTPSCSLTQPCLEICDNELDDDGDGLVDCFDTDCTCFDPDTFCLAQIPFNNFSAKMAWQSTVDAAHAASIPLVANMNPQQDNIPEILIMEGANTNTVGTIYKLLIFKGDGSNAANPDILPIPQGANQNLPTHPTVADLDNNGVPEVIMVTKDRKIRVYTDYVPNTNPCMQPWVVSTQPVKSIYPKTYAADLDGDGISEIISGNEVFKLDLSNPAVPTLTLALSGLGAAGNFRGTPGYGGNSTAADLLSPADCNGDPDCAGLEIAAGYHIYSIDLDPNDGDGLEIKIQRDLDVLDPTVQHSDGYTCTADIDLDGIPEVIVSNSYDNDPGGIYAWNKNGLVQKFYAPSISLTAGMVTVADVFDDTKAGFSQNFPELIVAQAQGLICFNLQKAVSTPAQPFWWKLNTIDHSGTTSTSVFDFNGDGIHEIVYRDEDHLRILYGGPAPFPPGVDAQRNWFKTITGSLTLDEYPVVADVDQDGAAEIVVTGYTVSVLNNLGSFNYLSRLRVFESADLPWQPARPVWNQYNYFNVNINDNLSLPKVQQKHWLEVGGPGTGKRPFNTHLAQVSSLNPLATTYIRTPDATITLDSSVCRLDSFDLFFSICNYGSATLPAGTPIAFYAGDPTTSAVPMLFPPRTFNEALEKGACTDIHLVIPAAYNQDIYVIVNDDGTLPQPINLLTDFPSTNQQECHYDNNMILFSVQKQIQALDLGPDITLCKNSVVELSANSGFQRYRWQDGTEGPNFTAYSPGKYWVDAYDACGFKQSDTINIVLNALKLLDLPEEVSVCAGQTVQLTASGFQKYNWAPSDSVSCPNCAAVDILAKNSITVYLTATEGDCFVSDSVQVHVNPPPLVSLSAQDGDCDSTAIITATVSGNGPFDFHWSNAGVDSVLYTSLSGVYSVEITDQNGCSVLDSAAVTVTTPLVLSTQATPPICANAATGAINLTVTGATPPLQFLWSNSAITEDLDMLQAGIYSAVVTDANGCMAAISETLTAPPAIVLSLEKTNPACAGIPSGALNLSASGGTGGLQFTWSNNAHTEDLNLLPAGIYSATATDANGCTATVSDTLIDPPVIVLSLEKTDLNCPGDTVLLDLTANGGVPPFTYSWSNGETSEDLNVVQAGAYSVMAKDANGCEFSAAASIAVLGAQPILSLSADTLNCQKTSGIISAISDLPNTSFLWSGPAGFSASTAASTVTTSGQFSVVATEPLGGCTAVGTVQVLIDTVAPTISLAAHYWEIPCDQSSVSISAAGSSNGPNYMIQWTAAVGGSILSGGNSLSPNLGSAGFYDVSITDLSNGCTASDALEVVQLAPPTGTASADSVRCFGAENGAVRVVSTAGGTPPLSYSMDNVTFQSSPDFENLAAGKYQIYIRDAGGCLFSMDIEVFQPAPIAVNLMGDSLIVKGAEAHLQAIVQPPGFVPAQIDWTPSNLDLVKNQLEQSVQLFQTTVFQVNITDEQGCSAADTLLVRVDGAVSIYTPNAIFPESPGGKNRVFLIFTGAPIREIESLVIFDRWGDQVFANHHFQGNDENAGWDGTFRGKTVAAGVYVWVAKVLLADGTLEVLSGGVTVVR